MFLASKRTASSSSSSSSSSPCSSPTSSSSSTSKWRYDVFLSFRGLDTRDNFSDHLYHNLVAKGIEVFRDDKKLGKGKVITETIFEAIKMSKFSVVVLSRNYAWSEWCLDELVKIIGYKNENGHITFPVFYHVTPADVMNQMGNYEEAFLSHQRQFKSERVQRWRNALAEIAGISGWDVQKYRSESKLVKSIVGKISCKLRFEFPRDGSLSVPLSFIRKEMNLYLYEGLDNMYIVRICGMEGMGGTTIARVFYDVVSNQKSGEFYNQELVYEMPRECSRNSWDDDRVINVIRKKLQGKKVLVLIDDVDLVEQVASLVRRHGWFVPGSRIIISAPTPKKMFLNVLDISFQGPEDRETLFDSSPHGLTDGKKNRSLDIACFFKEMDDDHITRIMRSLVSNNLQENSGMKILINKFLIHISDTDNQLIYDFIKDLNSENIAREHVEECSRFRKLLNMTGTDSSVGNDSKSSQSNWKSNDEPRKNLIAAKCRNQQQMLALDSVKVRDVSLVLRSSGLSDARRANDTTKLQPLLNIQEEFINSVPFDDNVNVLTNSLSALEEKLLQNMSLKKTNSKCSLTKIRRNGENMTGKGKNVASSDIGEMNDCAVYYHKIRGNKRQQGASLMDLQIYSGGKTSDQQLQFFTPESSNGKKIVRIPKAVAEEGIKLWKLSLVGQLLGETSDIGLIHKMANARWGKEGRIDVTKTENELYIFQFPNERTRDSALEYGPWSVENNVLVMRKWQPKMEPLELDKSKIPVWVKLRGIPLEYMTAQGLSYISSAIGKPLYMDRATAKKYSLAFPKVCVEISIEDEIMEKISIMDDDGDVSVVEVEYLWKPDKCIVCREFGHSTR